MGRGGIPDVSEGVVMGEGATFRFCRFGMEGGLGEIRLERKKGPDQEVPKKFTNY